MKTVEQREEFQKYFDEKFFGKKRIPTGPFDYGDEKTVWLHLKRVGSSIADPIENNNYAIYLGQHNDGYVVGVKDTLGTKILFCEIFESEEEMKSFWQLD